MPSWLPPISHDLWIWIGIVLCLSQSAMFSGLNLAFFSLNRLQLEVKATDENKAARTVLKMRQDSNFLLTTILWGNVGINVLLTLLSDSVMAGVAAFAFSAVFITIFGEITPQAYFSRHALKTASFLAPVLRFYQFLLYPVAKPCALVLDLWLGKEGITYMRERDLRQVIKRHMEAEETEVETIEGIGALNFLQIDDIPVGKEGETVNVGAILGIVSASKKLAKDKQDEIKNYSPPKKKELKNLDKEISGFNVGVNIGKDAGQSIMHCHLHLIPRRKGDVEDPRGGVRGVIPDKQKYKRK